MTMRAPGLLLEYLQALQVWSGAEQAALLMHMEPAERDAMFLCGELSAIPELSSREEAWALVQRAAGSKLEPLEVVPSTDPDVLLLRLAFDNIMVRPKARRRPVNERRSNPNVDAAPAYDGALWVALRGCEDPDRVIDGLLAQSLKLIDAGAGRGEAFASVLTSRMAWSVYQLTNALQDPVSQLPGRMEFQVFLKRALAASRQHGQALSLLLVNPDDFTMINHRYGREQGDLAVSEIAEALSDCLRETDGVFRYGGAVFGVVLPATDLSQCRAAAEKVRRMLAGRRYVGDREQLSFSMGAAAGDAEELKAHDIEAADLLRHADVALNRAKLSGGGSIVTTSISDALDQPALGNPLGGIFTADTEKDYRNMLLLWETVGLVSGGAEPEAMADAFVARLAVGFQPDRIVLLTRDERGELEAVASNVRDVAAQDGRVSGRVVKLEPTQLAIIDQALTSGQVERLGTEPEQGTATLTGYAVPLMARDHAVGCLYLDGQGQRLLLDSSDVIFLMALAGQLAVALDRAALAARWIREKDRESRELREELSELKQSLEQHQMVYESEEMHGLMDTLKRVAPSDATVLITGESGTGKEVLAHALHEHSARSEGPFVVFDCGAVAHTLIEAELFGHVKGAFTGAERASEGRIAQADGGTLFLDEIGELPLEVQAKLLRFVQEREFSPVGSAQTRSVDVRLVAATNRRLQDEVALGRFRADLYYRLQVISLQTVPLRHRVADILPLAEHFLRRFAVQHGRRASFTDAARSRLRSYDWPGNVRELQNAVLRALLMADDEAIDASQIELLPETTSHAAVNLVVRDDDPPAPTPAALAAESLTAPAVADELDEPLDVWRELKVALVDQIEVALKQNARRPVPLGRWLTEDLVLAASDAQGGVASRAAKAIGIPESTFRRHFQKARAEVDAGLSNRTPSWSSVGSLIEKIIATTAEGDEDVLERARLVLLGDVRDAVDKRIAAGAALMGVSSPTYKRWLAERQS